VILFEFGEIVDNSLY